MRTLTGMAGCQQIELLITSAWAICVSAGPPSEMSDNLLVPEPEPDPGTWLTFSPRQLTAREIQKLFEPVHYVVYEARDSDGNVMYVGRSWRLLRRIGEHARVASWLSDVDVVKLHHCPTDDHMVNLERALIRKLRPKFNRTERHPMDDYDRETLELHERYLETKDPLPLYTRD